MAKLSNINGRFAVEDDGAIQFNGQAGTSGYVLESRGASSPPVWTDRDTGNVTGSGTLNKVPRWTATGSNLGDGPITFSGSAADASSTFGGDVTANGNVTIANSSPDLYLFPTGSFHSFRVSAQENVANTFEITPSTTAGGSTYSNPALSISHTGNSTFSGNIQVDGGFKDSSGDIGTAGQILSSTATGTNWIDNDTGDISGSGVAGEVAYFTGAKTIANNAGMSFSNQQIQFDGIGGADGYILPYDQNPGYSNMAAGGFGLLFREAYDSYVTNNTYYYKTGGTAQWRAKYTTKGASVLSMLDGKFNFETAPANTTSPHNLSLSTKMTILEGGNVGIGVSSPVGKLQVSLPTYTNEDTNSQQAIFGVDSGYGVRIGYNETDNKGYINVLKPGVAWGSLILQEDIGKVGIGTDSPAMKIDVEDNSTTWAGRVLNTNANGAGLLVRSDATTANDTIVLGVYGDGGYKMAVKSGGNVGIGTTSPGAKLDLGSTQAGGMQFLYDTTQAYRHQILNYWNSSPDSRMDFNIGRTANVAPVTVMSVGYDGNVGIGTITPGTALEIKKQIPAGNRTVPLDILTIFGYGPNVLPYTGSGGGIVFKNTTYSYGDLNSARIRSYIDSDSGSNRGAGLVFEVTNSNQTYNPSLFLKYNGNVGIGVTGPVAPLDVFGAAVQNGSTPGIKLSSSNTQQTVFAIGNTGTRQYELAVGGTTSSVPGAFYVYDNNAADFRITIQPGGQIQLNAYDGTNKTGTPTYLLGADASGNIVKTITGATTGTQVHSLAATGGTASWKKLGTFTAAMGGQSVFIKMVTNAGYNSSISQNVEVYIRFKTSNGGSLDPNGFSGDSSFYTHGPNASFPAGNIKWVSNAAGTSATSYALYALIPNYSGNGGFYVVENSAGTWVNNMSNASDPGAASSTVMIPAEQFRVGSTDFVVNGGGGDAYFANSNVGIGNTSPGTKLHVSSTGTSTRFQSSGSYSDIQFVSTAGMNFVNFGSANEFLLYQGGGAGANITTKIDTSGNATFKGDVVAYGSPSDIRLKENIKPIKSALDKVSKLNGVTFDWKEKTEHLDKEGNPINLQQWKHDIGFIAQDVQKVVPELVRENDNGMLSMRHQGIAPILLEAIKELKAEIEELKKCKCDCKK